MSMSFDRAATYYDATRGLPTDTAAELAQLLTGELSGRGRCLEIGVGTGRIALPLHERGIDLVGTDIALPMVEQLRANARGAPPAVLLADARSLPFVTGSFGAILASHVLHLLADWTRAVDEAFRVLRPRGCFLVDFGGGAEAPWGKLAHAILDGYGVHRVRPGASHVEPVADYLTRRAVSRPLPPLRLAVHRSLARDLRDWEEQIYSWTWPYPAEQMARACAAVRVEAERQSIDVDEVVELERVIQWWAFDRVPGGP